MEMSTNSFLKKEAKAEKMVMITNEGCSEALKQEEKRPVARIFVNR